MKYLQMVEYQADDLGDSIYSNITVPSVRFVKDSNSVIARKTTNEKKSKFIDMAYLLTISCGPDSAFTYDEYFEGLSAGTYTSDYAKSLTESKSYDDFLSGALSAFGKEEISLDPNSIEEKLSLALSTFGSYSGVEVTLLSAISYKSDYDNDIELDVEVSGETSASTSYNEYDNIVSILDFNEDGKIDEEDALILRSFKKYFPEQISEYGFNTAYGMLSAETASVLDVANSVLGLDEYNEDFDLNGNGIVDEEDLAMFVSADIFGDCGDVEIISTRRKTISTGTAGAIAGAIAGGFATVANSNIDAGPARPPRGWRRDTGDVTYQIKGSISQYTKKREIHRKNYDSKGRSYGTVTGYGNWVSGPNCFVSTSNARLSVSRGDHYDNETLRAYCRQELIRELDSTVYSSLCIKGYDKDTYHWQYKYTTCNVQIDSFVRVYN